MNKRLIKPKQVFLFKTDLKAKIQMCEIDYARRHLRVCYPIVTGKSINNIKHINNVKRNPTDVI